MLLLRKQAAVCVNECVWIVTFAACVTTQLPNKYTWHIAWRPWPSTGNIRHSTERHWVLCAFAHSIVASSSYSTLARYSNCMSTFYVCLFSALYNREPPLARSHTHKHIQTHTMLYNVNHLCIAILARAWVLYYKCMLLLLFPFYIVVFVVIHSFHPIAMGCRGCQCGPLLVGYP